MPELCVKVSAKCPMTTSVIIRNFTLSKRATLSVIVGFIFVIDSTSVYSKLFLLYFTLRKIFKSPFKHYYTFNMISLWEHIKGADVFNFVATFYKCVQISSLSFRVAGNIHDFFRCKFQNRM